MSSPTEGRAHAVLRVCSLPYGLRRGASAPRRTQQGRGPWESQLHEMTKPAGTGGRYMKRLASPGAAKTTRMALPQQDPSLTGSAGNISPGASTCVFKKRNGRGCMCDQREKCFVRREKAISEQSSKPKCIDKVRASGSESILGPERRVSCLSAQDESNFGRGQELN